MLLTIKEISHLPTTFLVKNIHTPPGGNVVSGHHASHTLHSFFFLFFSFPQDIKSVTVISIAYIDLHRFTILGLSSLTGKMKRSEQISPRSSSGFTSLASLILEHKNSSGSNSCLLEPFPTAGHLCRAVTQLCFNFIGAEDLLPGSSFHS